MPGIAAEHGFDVTTGDLAAAAPDRDLSETDLEAVSGGAFTDPALTCRRG